ncbi:premnaspirodiene oxygenase-like [Canna indica]|uniref:Premnaspirodiene oxygenase-like n=1 Tax=Canna indica TaxID=4628 RepID=A0AAQ3JMP5_9LILI|nr:premnaspirodiene oxygenase-like [Canna indica]
MVFSINRHAISIISTATHPDSTMELFYISLFLISFLLLLKFFSPSQAKKRAAMLPPGPPKLPVIGSLHHLRGSLPHRIFRDLAQTYGPLMHLQLGEISTVVVSSKDVAREMLTTHDKKFSSRPDILASRIIVYDGTDMLFAPYGEYWRQLRKIGVMEVLSPKRVQSFRRVREEEALDLVLRVRTAAGSSSPVNLSELILSLMNNVVARAAIGSKCNDASTYLKALKEGVELASGFSLPDLFPSFSIVGSVTGIKSKLENCHKRIDAILDGIVEEQMKRRASAMMKRGNGDDESSVVMEDNILDVLLNLQAKNADGFTLTRTNIKALIFVSN